MLVIGGRDMDAGNVSVRLHGKGNVGAKPKGEVVADILASDQRAPDRRTGAEHCSASFTFELVHAERCSALRYAGSFNSRVCGSRKRALPKGQSSGTRQSLALTGLLSM